MKKKLLSMLLVLALCVGCVAVLASCGKEKDPPHEHSYGAWVADGATQHKRTCSCGDVQKEDHTFGALSTEVDADGMYSKTCSVCGYEAKVEREYEWDNTDLIFWIHDTNHNNELLAGNRAFLAGDTKWTAGHSLELNDTDILEAVKTRNSTAQRITKTSVTYNYGTNLGWGKQMPEIITLVNSGDAATPDAFAGFTYDMVGAQVNGVFKNIKGNEYFAFNSAKYDPTKDEKGYFWDYMQSMTFSTQGMFLIASNYSVDIVRAYFVTPISRTLLKKTGLSDEKMVEMINNKQYTWSLIADMTDGNAEKNITGIATPGADGTYDFKKTNEGAVWGMGFVNGSKMAFAGVTYANDYNIISRTLDPSTGDYVYSYNVTADANGDIPYPKMVKDFAQILGGSDGIINVASNSYVGSTNDVACVSLAFTEGRMLVGGVQLLGYIESTDFRNMWEGSEGGFIVAPMPLYHEGDEYRTVVHNLATVIGIAKSSTKLDQMAAFLNYQSTHSEDILNDYYNWSLAYGTAGAFEANIEIIKEMRNHLVYAIDKITDDVLSLTKAFAGTDFKDLGDVRYHAMFQASYKNNTDVTALYRTLAPLKGKALNELQKQFIEACDASTTAE